MCYPHKPVSLGRVRKIRQSSWFRTVAADYAPDQRGALALTRRDPLKLARSTGIE